MLKFIFKPEERKILNISSKHKSGFYPALNILRTNISKSLWGIREKTEKETINNIKNLLVSYDFGVTTTKKIIELLVSKTTEKRLKGKDEILYQLKLILVDLLYVNKQDVDILHKSYEKKNRLEVILLVGANGVGKTTTASKIAYLHQSQGKSVTMVAGDRFRAAAIEQLEKLGSRINMEVLSNFSSQDVGTITRESIVFAKRNKRDVLIIDTAGRMHTRKDLMAEVKRIKSVLNKEECIYKKILLVLDSNLGQNSFIQAEKFMKDVGIDSLVLTKLDGSAGGGIIFAIADKLQLGIEFIGFGENIKDIKKFNPTEYVNTLLEAKQGGSF